MDVMNIIASMINNGLFAIICGLSGIGALYVLQLAHVIG